MRLMCDVDVTVYAKGKTFNDSVRLEFEDQQFAEFDFGKFFQDMMRKLSPDLVDVYPKERIIFDIRRIHKAIQDPETLKSAYTR